jgi:hypothetical protein
MRLLALASALPALLLCCTGLAQAAGVTVKTLNFEGKNERGEAIEKGEITMPLVQLPDAAVAARINDRLFIGQLNSLAPRASATRVTAADGAAITGLASQRFTLSRNDGKLLTVAFDNEGCGAYCEGYSVAYSFDVATGALLTAGNLFTPAGMLAASQRMRTEQVARYRQQVASLNKDIKALHAREGGKDHAKSKTATPQGEDLSDLEERLELNKSCLAEQQQAERTPTAANASDLFSRLRFELADKGLHLTAGRCSNHAMRALDDVGDVPLTVSYAAAAPWLSAYGKAVLLGGPAAAPADGLFGQVLRGTLITKGTGAIPVTALLDKSADNSVGGSYFYDKVRKQIELTGMLKGNALELTEHIDAADGAPKPSEAVMHLTRSGNELKGTWVGQKQFDMRLAP